MRRLLVCIVMTVAVLSLGLIIGCSSDAADRSKVLVNPVTSKEVVEYPNGVYFFPFTNAKYCNELSAFIGKHPNLEFVGATGNGTGPYGYNQGYIVVFRTK